VRNGNSKTGFTLIELTLAMFMTAIISLSLYMTLSVAWKARRTAYGAVAPTRTGAIAADIIRQDFESVQWPSANSLLSPRFEGTHSSSGTGDSDQVELYTIQRDLNNLDSPLSECVHGIQYFVNNQVNPPVLVRRVQRNLLAQFQPTPEDEVLCRNVRSFSIRYFDGTDWQTDWSSDDAQVAADVLPIAVQITLGIDDPQQLDSSGKPLVRSITRSFPILCARPNDDTAVNQ
jgi:type II secretion system protein J